MEPKGKVIGIGGISRSGKSFLAKRLSEIFAGLGKKAVVLDQDDFVFPESAIPLIQGHIDWEAPDSIDFAWFRSAIQEAQSLYDIVIAEGLMVFHDPEILRLLDYTIFIELTKEEFVFRKQADLRWGKEPDWYIEHIWEGYLKFGRFPESSQPDLVLNGNELFDVDGIYKQIII